MVKLGINLIKTSTRKYLEKLKFCSQHSRLPNGNFLYNCIIVLHRIIGRNPSVTWLCFCQVSMMSRGQGWTDPNLGFVIELTVTSSFHVRYSSALPNTLFTEQRYSGLKSSRIFCNKQTVNCNKVNKSAIRKDNFGNIKGCFSAYAKPMPKHTK